MPGVMKSEKNPLQPPQPTDLQGLLRFAMEATRAEDAAGSSTFETIDDEVLHTILRNYTIINGNKYESNINS